VPASGRRIVAVLTHSRIALAGLVLSLTSSSLFLVFLGAELVGLRTGPYFGIVGFLFLPVPFVLGLVLIPIGYLRARRRLSESGGAAAPLAPYPVLDLNVRRHRRNLLLFGVLTIVNVALLGTASYKGVHYMESDAFCGQVCHTVMRPEFVASRTSPHARVGCVHCHVGSGAEWFVRTKLSGVRQLVGVALHNYPRPIPTPVQDLRPARETCEECHWPDQHHGDRLRVIRSFAEDEASSEQVTVLVLHVGGGHAGGQQAGGIHWHMNLANEITYIAADESRQTIPWVRLKDASGGVTDFTAGDAGLTAAQIASAAKRTMDCVDCHNRPAHRFEQPDEAADQAIAALRLDRGLPFLKQQMVGALKGSYASREAALQGIQESLDRYYRENHPEVYARSRKAIDAVIEATRNVHAANVFPEMGVTWGTYPNNLGHESFPGCFRCHDGNHSSPDGRVIRQDCDTCHALPAMEEPAPAILKDLGVGAESPEGGAPPRAES